MRRPLALLIVVVMVASAESGGPVFAQSSASSSHPALVTYLEGLDALIQGRWPEAVTAFTRSLQANGATERDAGSRRGSQPGRAIPDALADFQQADRMGLKGGKPSCGRTRPRR